MEEPINTAAEVPHKLVLITKGLLDGLSLDIFRVLSYISGRWRNTLDGHVVFFRKNGVVISIFFIGTIALRSLASIKILRLNMLKIFNMVLLLKETVAPVNLIHEVANNLMGRISLTAVVVVQRVDLANELSKLTISILLVLHVRVAAEEQTNNLRELTLHLREHSKLKSIISRAHSLRVLTIKVKQLAVKLSKEW